MRIARQLYNLSYRILFLYTREKKVFSIGFVVFSSLLSERVGQGGPGGRFRSRKALCSLSAGVFLQGVVCFYVRGGTFLQGVVFRSGGRPADLADRSTSSDQSSRKSFPLGEKIRVRSNKYNFYIFILYIFNIPHTRLTHNKNFHLQLNKIRFIDPMSYDIIF